MQLLKPVRKNLGDFTVQRVLPAPSRQLVGPFIFFDHMGPAQFAPGAGVNVRPHPHIGLATVTYLFEGIITHRDTLGYDQPITAGAVNWMTAGKGIAHSERTPPEMVASGSKLHGIQAWLALPLEKEEGEPSFVHYSAAEIPEKQLEGIAIRVIAGDAFGVRSPVATASPTIYAELQLAANSRIAAPSHYDELALYVVSGEITVSDMVVTEGCMLVLDTAQESDILANKTAHVMILGGAAIEGERHLWWNFVSSSQARIEQAKKKWRQREFGAIKGENEFIPLPD